MPKFRGNKRIGPHNIDILSKIYGSLLGDSNASRINNRATYIVLHQEDSNIQYLVWFHKKLVELGYCKPELPNMESRIGPHGKIRYFYRLRTFSYSSFNYIHESFYNDKGIKGVPFNIADYLTPLALTIWICDNGSKQGSGLKLSTHSFTKGDVELLRDV